MRQVTGWLARNTRPGRAAIDTAIDAVGFIRHTDIDRLGRIAGGPRSPVECHPDNSDDICGICIARVLNVIAGIWKARDFGPRRAEIDASPEAVAAACPQKENAVPVWIDR